MYWRYEFYPKRVLSDPNSIFQKDQNLQEFQ